MRRTVIALAWLLCPAPLLAAPAPTGPAPAAAPATQTQLQAAAREYAQNLTQVVDTIERGYVRPVSRLDLIEAALTGLYEAAQVPAPGTLKADLKKAEKGAPLDALVVKARLGAGNAEALQGPRALIASCRAMMRALDPFCSVVSGEESTVVTGFDQNFGLGIDLVERAGSGPLVVKAVVPGGPAQRAGLQAGDRIMRVDDKDTRTLSTERALRLLNGGRAAAQDDLPPIPPPPGAPDTEASGTPPVQVSLTVRSVGDKEERKVSLRRESFQPETVQGVTRNEDNSWDYWVDRKNRIAHVRVVALAKHTAFELEQVLDRLDGGSGLRGLILDLRWCPGGYLTSATGVAGLFLEDGVIAKTEIRAEGQHVYKAEGGTERKFLNFPIVVLVNGETTGGGELITAALQDHHRAAVAGQRTRGKGSIQTPSYVHLVNVGVPLELKLTNGTFLRPSGKNLGRFADSKASDDWGVKPDEGLEFRTSADLARRLKEWWQQQALRPGASHKALPLDDPDQDPQRQAALKALRAIMAGKK
jgi:carboxyl-terminal processing protease